MVTPQGSAESRRGVALVDAIIAAVLLGLALVALVGLTGRAVSSQMRGEQLQIAAMLLDEQLNLVLMRGPDDYSSRFPTEGPCESPFEGYRYRLELSGGAGGDPYLVRATLVWEAGGRTRSESIETLIAPRLGEEPERRPAESVGRVQ